MYPLNIILYPPPRSSPIDAKDTLSENGHGKRGILGKVSRGRAPRSASLERPERDEPEVLVIKLASTDDQDYVGESYLQPAAEPYSPDKV